MRRLIGFLLAAALGAPSLAAGPQVIDDWRKVGPPDGEDPPHAKGELSPAAAERLVAAIDGAWRSGRPLRARGDKLEWVVDNLRYFHLRADGRAAPPSAGSAEAQERDRDLLRRVEVLGVRPIGRQALLLATTSVAFDESAFGFQPTTLGVVLAPDGAVTDVAILAWSAGDGGYAIVRSMRLLERGVRLTEAECEIGNLCSEEPGAPPCDLAEGETYDLVVGNDGRFVESERHPMNLTGLFVDRATDEELRVEQLGTEPPRLFYRARRGAPSRRLATLSTDPKRRLVRAKFTSSPVTYALTLAADGKWLVSAGSDGSKPQRFERIPRDERHEREP